MLLVYVSGGAACEGLLRERASVIGCAHWRCLLRPTHPARAQRRLVEVLRNFIRSVDLAGRRASETDVSQFLEAPAD